MANGPTLWMLLRFSRRSATFFLVGVSAVTLQMIGQILGGVLPRVGIVGFVSLGLYAVYFGWWTTLPKVARHRATFAIFPFLGRWEFQAALDTLRLPLKWWRLRDLTFVLMLVVWLIAGVTDTS